MRNFVFASLLVLSLGVCNGQSSTGKPAEPAAIGVVFYLDSSTQELKPLPNEQWKAKGRPGWTTATGVIEVSGVRSAFRINSGEKTEFIFKTEHPETVSIYAFVLKKDHRQFDLVKVGRERETIQGIPAELTKFGDSSYRLVPNSPLGPGEYVINMAGKMFTFGIDR
ncbi:MAG: hypothetical protein ABSD44_15535 [Terracidiphilus sp.]